MTITFNLTVWDFLVILVMVAGSAAVVAATLGRDTTRRLRQLKQRNDFLRDLLVHNFEELRLPPVLESNLRRMLAAGERDKAMSLLTERYGFSMAAFERCMKRLEGK